MLGLWSAITLAIVGQGAPLPVDHAHCLVTKGPYDQVRNSPALAAIGPGIAIGVAFGSLLVLLYVVVGGLAWHEFLRPREEEHLHDRYGKQWEQYRRKVRALVPRLHPFKLDQAERVPAEGVRRL